MQRMDLNFTLSYADSATEPPKDKIAATVPGAVGLDYAKAKNYPPYYFSKNYENFSWMEDKYFTYESEFELNLTKDEFAFLVFEGIDYEFDIKINGKLLLHKEGMFTPTKIDITEYNAKKCLLQTVIYPIPKSKNARRKHTRDEAAESCKPASSYGWDWHPRLVPSGIWKSAYIEIHKAAPTELNASYRLSEDLKSAKISAEINTVGIGNFTLALIAPSGETVYEERKSFADSAIETIDFSIDSPLLWYPVGYGEHPVYTLAVYNEERRIERKIGFRRVKLLRNFDDTNPVEKAFPKSRYPAPATIEINGVRVFAKGSNWVNTEIFPALMTYERYDELLRLVVGANMNILRMWGGGFINHDCFYDLCDSYGIMVWQEFMLSCNLHPDTDEYLSVLENEATYIIKNLRTHPSLTLWCGGNELFNSWSGLTDQSHPLRLLSSLCYTLDRFTPFNMTSPLEGMGHGTYNTLFNKRIAKADTAGLGGEIDCNTEEEFITVLTRSYFTAYTEFGSSGGASPEYIKKYIMSEEDYNLRSENHPIWIAHHAYRAWTQDCWLRPGEINYYFGGFEDTDDLMNKSLLVQSISYKSLFEEMRRQWPHCSMAVNWDLNEPWPCIAGNSLINWPCEPKPAYFAVKEALRPTIASIKTGKNRFLSGETMNADIFILNDSPDVSKETNINVYLIAGGEKQLLTKIHANECKPRANLKVGSFELPIEESFPSVFEIILEVEDHPEMNSHYKLIKK